MTAKIMLKLMEEAADKLTVICTLANTAKVKPGYDSMALSVVRERLAGASSELGRAIDKQKELL